MIKLSGGAWYKIAGRGDVYAVNIPEDCYSYELMSIIEIEGAPYKCTGIESFAKYRDQDPIRGTRFKAGESLGLLVRKDLGKTQEDKENEILGLIMQLVQSARKNDMRLYRETKKSIKRLKLDPEYRETVLKMLEPFKDVQE